MHASTILLSILAPLALAAPVEQLTRRFHGPKYSGPPSNFPAMSTWKDFNTIFSINKPDMFRKGDTGEDVGRIWNAVNGAARDIGVQERVIFCIIMQESTGDVGVRTTIAPDKSHSGGLMQAAESPGFPGQHGLSQVSINEYSLIVGQIKSAFLLTIDQDQINRMIYAGTRHYKENLKSFGNGNDAPTIYKALRMYNSGSVNEQNLSDGRGATASYVSDVANCLRGERQ